MYLFSSCGALIEIAPAMGGLAKIKIKTQGSLHPLNGLVQ